MCTPFFCWGSNLQKEGGLDQISIFRGDLLGKRGGGGLSQARDYSFYMKNKLKSELFNDKKSL